MEVLSFGYSPCGSLPGTRRCQPAPQTGRVLHLLHSRRSKRRSSLYASRGPGEASSSGRAGMEEGPPSSGKRFKSSWDAKEAGQEGQAGDFLSNLGTGQNYNINVDHGQNIDHVDSLFTGDFLGHKSDIADGTLRGYEFRTFNNVADGYYIAPRFLDAVAMHIVKNYLKDRGCFDPHTNVPVILGIWGEKGQGKTFQTELAFKKLGVEPIVMSSGELEHEWAGTPGRLIRERYRRASELSKVRGKLSCLVINDIDAGLGHFENTQVTVNNQIVIGTLMNIADEPNRVSVGQEWREGDYIGRVPIVVTGNDFTRMFAPLIRDGRMAKFYWKPSQEDLVNILWQMYQDDGLRYEDMGALLDAFPGQSLDFFGALRSATYDGQIRDWIERDVISTSLDNEDANLSDMSKRLVTKQGLPVFEQVELRLSDLMAEGRRLVTEQDHINSIKLSTEYLKDTGNTGGTLVGFRG
eukprot:jgi/Botrbrau1/23279/Bobra.0102s0022.1